MTMMDGRPMNGQFWVLML